MAAICHAPSGLASYRYTNVLTLAGRRADKPRTQTGRQGQKE